MENPIIFQAFEWDIPNDGTHWKNIADIADSLSKMGITAAWLPPASKGSAGNNDVGYGIYDHYDLGEFDQKGSIPTKYGTKDEYLAAIQALKDAGLEVYADIVFDHLMGADETEKVEAIAYSFDDRLKPVSGEEEIEAWTKFTYPGRKGKYNDYQWNWQNFSGVDYDARSKDHAIYNLAKKGWQPEVDNENGNFDYLMGCNLDMEYPETVEQLDKWGKWFQALTDMDGYRLDAVKHIQFDFFVDWLLHRQEEKGKEMFVVGEYWSDDLGKLQNYLDSSGNLINLFDVPLHFNFYEASNSMGGFDMRNILQGTLVESHPDWAVTFVDNHDTQVGQSLQSWIDGWFKLHAYTLILLRSEGVPVVFWGDLFGIPAQDVDPVGPGLSSLMKIRHKLAFGGQSDYFDHPNLIGWTRTGSFDHENSGYAVVMTNSKGGEKEMTVSAYHGGKTFIDVLGNHDAKVVLDDTGKGVFPVNDGQISVYVNEKAAEKIWDKVEEQAVDIEELN